MMYRSNYLGHRTVHDWPIAIRLLILPWSAGLLPGNRTYANDLHAKNIRTVQAAAFARFKVRYILSIRVFRTNSSDANMAKGA